MDWLNLIADEDMILEKNFTVGRAGKNINKIVVHHNAGTLTIKGCYDVWQEREASAHYQVEREGRIGQLVHDKDTAWHAGDWEVNTTSIGIEHANQTLGPTWTVSKETIDAGAHLVAALCHFYKLGVPEWGKNVFQHKDFSSTSCPGALATTQKDLYMNKAKGWYFAMSSSTVELKPEEAQQKPILPAWYLPAGHYFGDINGPKESHGGHHSALAYDRQVIKRIQQMLIYKGYVDGVTDVNSPWADGIWEQPTTDALIRFQKKELPNSTSFWGLCWSDDYQQLAK